MSGVDIRRQLQNSNMKQWELAQKLNVSESTLIRWLRTELPQEKKERILKLITDHGKQVKRNDEDN